MNERLRDSYEALLLAYVAGALDAAQNLAVAAHAALSLNARMRIAQLEALGGALLCQGCEPHNMSEGALDKVLGKLDACCGEEGKEDCCHAFPDNIKVPMALNRTIYYMLGTPVWQSYIPGFQMFELPLPCPRSSVRFIKAEPGKQTPAHVPQGMEITLLLDGGLRDENGYYSCGDLIVMETADGAHSPVSCREQGAISMVVSSKSDKIG